MFGSAPISNTSYYYYCSY